MQKQIYLAGGCFWGVEKYISLIGGVIETEVGYANGKTSYPSYEDVCGKETGHAETVRVVFDTDVISTGDLLRKFFAVIDPTSINRQGGDTGSQYRTGIYYEDGSDMEIIDAIKKSLNELSLLHQAPIAIEALKLLNYYRAEEYHQKYLDKNPGGYCHIPKNLLV